MAEKIFIVTGEASGDAHAGRMIKALKKQRPEIEVAAVGGDRLRDAGAEIIIDFSELAVMGLIEVIKRYRQIKQQFNRILARFAVDKPDLLILVDYPGFNLKLAKQAKKRGITVLYYISPKVWASRAGRIKTIKRYVDHMAVLFPFEETLYQQAGVAVSCVGHPLVDAVHSSLSRTEAKAKLEIAEGQRVIGLFPGSRRSEVDVLLPLMIAAVTRITARDDDITVVLPLAAGLSRDYLQQKIKQTGTDLPIKIVADNFYDVIQACDVIAAASGTVTLEIALIGTPHFICYRVAPLSYAILKRLLLIPYVGLCNIVTQKPVIHELLQNEVTAESLDSELTKLLTDPAAKAKAEIIRQEVLSALGPAGGADNAAQLVLKILDKQL